MSKYLLYNELNNRNPIRISEEDAIAEMKSYGKTQNREYQNDQEALQDFITLHWAWYESESSIGDGGSDTTDTVPRLD
jgi:hypothetical protein